MESIPDKTLWMSAVRIKWNVAVTKYSNRWNDVASVNATGAWLIPWWGPPTTSPLRSFSEKVGPLSILKTLLTETQTIIFLRSACIFLILWLLQSVSHIANLMSSVFVFVIFRLYLLLWLVECGGHIVWDVGRSASLLCKHASRNPMEGRLITTGAPLPPPLQPLLSTDS